MCWCWLLFSAQTFDMQASFDLVDANKDGAISELEFEGLYNTFDDNGNSLFSLC